MTGDHLEKKIFHYNSHIMKLQKELLSLANKEVNLLDQAKKHFKQHREESEELIEKIYATQDKLDDVKEEILNEKLRKLAMLETVSLIGECNEQQRLLLA